MTGIEQLTAIAIGDVRLQVIDKNDGHVIGSASLLRTLWRLHSNMMLVNIDDIVINVERAGQCSGYFQYSFSGRLVRSTNKAEKIDGQNVCLTDRIHVAAGDYWFTLDLDEGNERTSSPAT